MVGTDTGESLRRAARTPKSCCERFALYGRRERVLDRRPVAAGQVVGEPVERGARSEPDELGLGAAARAARSPRRRPRAATRRWSSTFIETCATPPRCGSSSPIARTPGSPSSPPSRISAAIRRASSSVAGGASSTLKATSGGRAATSTAPARRVRARRAEVRRQLAGRDAARRARRARRGAARRACGRRRARRRGRPAGPSSWPSRSATTSASAHAAPRRASSRWTTGTTSIAPTCGCEPAWRAQVDPLDRGARALEQRGRERAGLRRRA